MVPNSAVGVMEELEGISELQKRYGDAVGLEMACHQTLPRERRLLAVWSGRGGRVLLNKRGLPGNWRETTWERI